MIEERSIPWAELLEAAFRRYKTILVITVVGFALAAAYVSLQLPVYKAVAKIQFTANALSAPQEAMSEKQVQAEVALLKSDALIRSVIDDFASSDVGQGQDMSKAEEISQPPAGSEPKDAVPMVAAQQPGIGPTSNNSREVQSIANRIYAEAVGRSNLVEVAYLDTDPVRAASFVNSLLEQHVQRIADLNEQTSALGLYQEQRDVLAQKWMDAADDLQSYRQQQGSDLLAGDQNHLEGVIGRLESDKVASETQYLELMARSEYLRRALLEYPKTVNQEQTITENEAFKLLQSKIMELEIEKSQKLSIYTPTSKIIQDLDRQLEEAQRLLSKKEGETLAATTTTLSETYKALEVDLVQTEAQITSTTARVEALKSQINRYREELSQLESSAGELERLESEVASAKESHQSYLRKEEQARFSRSLDESRLVNVVIVERAVVPTNPETSNSGLRVLTWTLLSFLIGLVVALARDWFDPTIKSATQLARASQVAVIGEIPAN